MYYVGVCCVDVDCVELECVVGGCDGIECVDVEGVGFICLVHWILCGSPLIALLLVDRCRALAEVGGSDVGAVPHFPGVLV